MSARISVIWRAGADGLGHAHRRGAKRTVCMLTVLDERFAWPVTRRCPDCTSLLAAGASA